ncbi:AMP-binding protein [Alphaproteobacteria bacterium KMM 3653]|uniref:AMP-binding protein n=1 Tax=Harenicola maris TaxID=2841044 RepID=A0AAP2CQP7_9RHOB|nr:AMP-binding protein [Harenicola maris]
MSVLPEIFAKAAEQHGPKLALIDGTGRSISFGELAVSARAYAARLEGRGVTQGTRVLVAAPIGIDLYIILAGLWQIGAVAVFPEPQMGLRGLLNAVKIAGPRAFACSGAYRWLKLLPQLWTLPAITPKSGGQAAPTGPLPAAQAPALISFTSGSTGTPKAIERSHAFLMAQHAAVAPLLASPNEERDLVAFPIFALINLAAGRTSILPDWPLGKPAQVTPAHLAGYLRSTRATRALLPPALCTVLSHAQHPPALHSLFTGGGPVFPDMIDALLAAAPDLQITSVYGSTEAEPIAHLHAAEITQQDRADMASGAGLLAGPPVPQVQIKLDKGEILVSGDHVNKGYLDPARDAENKLKDGDTIWHRTGDAGRLDDTGRLWLLGRIGAAVDGPQGPIHPFAIETAARQWPGVREAALGTANGTPTLAIKGDRSHLPEWKAKAAAMGVIRLQPVRALPYDRRHGSKIDAAALRKLLEAAQP